MPKTQTGFRLSPDLIPRLKEEAAKENRSLANLVETILAEWLKQQEGTVRKIKGRTE